jgi:hypothetical protein
MAESILATYGLSRMFKVLARPLAGVFTPCFRYPNLEGIRRRRRAALIRLARIGISSNAGILRKEVIQPQVPLRLPCYDFTPVADLTVACCLKS